MQNPFASSLLSGLLLTISFLAAANDAATDIQVIDPWVRETPPGMQASAGFMQLHNQGRMDHRLVGAASPQSGNAELHTHVHDNGVMRMRPVKDIPIRAGSTAALQPGGDHIMLMQLKGPLKAGEKMPITLTFEDGSSRTIEAEVRNFSMQMHKH